MHTPTISQVTALVGMALFAVTSVAMPIAGSTLDASLAERSSHVAAIIGADIVARNALEQRTKICKRKNGGCTDAGAGTGTGPDVVLVPLLARHRVLDDSKNNNNPNASDDKKGKRSNRAADNGNMPVHDTNDNNKYNGKDPRSFGADNLSSFQSTGQDDKGASSGHKVDDNSNNNDNKKGHARRQEDDNDEADDFDADLDSEDEE